MEELVNVFRDLTGTTFGKYAVAAGVLAILGATSYIIQTRGFRVFAWGMTAITGAMWLAAVAAKWLVG